MGMLSAIRKVALSSGICNPRGSICGCSIRAGHRPAVNPLWIANPQGQSYRSRYCKLSPFVLGDLQSPR